MNKLLKEAFHTYQLYLTTSGVLDAHHAKLGILKWPDIAQSALAMIDALENGKDNVEDIRMVLARDLESAILEPIKSLFQAAITRAVSIAGTKVDSSLLYATKNDSETDVVKLKDVYIGRINAVFELLEKETKDKYPKLHTQKETPVREKEVK